MENSEIPPDIDRETAKRINFYLTRVRDDLYRMAQGLSYNDPSRLRLWKLADEVEDEKIALLRRCSQCQKGDVGDG